MKFLRYLQKKRRAIFALAALTIFSSPFSAHASTITAKDSSHDKTITFKNNVYTIGVQKELNGGSVGVNKFKDFTLDKGQIANMQFGKLQSLANLVDNKININGTVNALRDGKIGGNLYFLSPNGIAVGASGVINAGAFTGMAVSQSYFDKLSKIDSGSEFMTQLAPKNIEYNNDPDKGIDIQGVINAPGGIHLYATKIDVGKDAKLRTDVSDVDFTKVVNVEGVDSGITEGLDASYSGGDIVLKAYASHVADDNIIKNISGETASQWEKVTEREATINVEGKIISAGDVSINAEAVTTFSEGSAFNVISQTGFLDALLGNLGIDVAADFAKKTNTATVNIKSGAEISSKGDMDIGATSTLDVTINATTPAVKSGTTKATDWIPATSVAVISATNKATVNIDGKLESKGAMAINAKATTSLSSTANSATFVTKTTSEEKNVKEDAHYIAVSVIDGETKAEVNINSGSEITVGGSDTEDAKAFEATATTENSISNSSTAATKATSIGSKVTGNNDDVATTTAVNVTDYTATANVNVKRAITVENGGIKLDATNTFENSMSAGTVTGREVKPMENWSEITDTPFLKALSSNLAAKITSKLQKATSNVPDEGGGSTLSKLFNGEYLKTGITVGVFLQDNNAKVNVDNKAVLKAKNDIDISAKNDITSQAFNVTSTVNNQTSNQKTNAMIGLGVLYSEIENNADIVNKGNLTSTSGDVNLETTSGMNYNQFEAVVDSIAEAFEEIGKDLKEIFQSEEAEAFEKYEEQVKTQTDKLEKTEDPAEYMQALDDLNEAINDTETTEYNAFVQKFKGAAKLKSNLEELPSKLTAFIHPSSYANYYALSAFVSNTQDGNKDVKFEAAGSFSINSMLNNSRIVVGENSVITAENGSVNTNSLAQNRVVAITGMGGEHLTSSEAQNNGAGISVFVGDFQNNAACAFGKNSQIKSKDIKLETKDYAKHVNIIYGNGKADSTSITGMVSYITSPGNSILALDDSTKLNGSGDVELNALSEKYITSVNGGITMGNGNGKSFGAAVNILNNDGTTAVLIADNGVNSELKSTIESLQKEIETESEKDSPDQDILVDKKTELKALKIAKTTQEILGEGYTEKLGTSSNDKGEITADTFTTKSENTGTINSIAVEGTENSESHGFADQFNDKVYKGEVQLGYADNALKYTSSMLIAKLGTAITEKFKSGQKNANDASNQAGNAAGNENGGAGENAGVNNNVESQLNVAGAGSAAINIKSGETGSYISNSNITAKNIDVSANDDAFNGSWAGAGAFNFFGNSQAAKNTNVAIGGAVAYSDNSKNVDAIIKNSTINATSIKNKASRDDSDVAAGFGLAVSTNSGEQGTNVDVAISASINFIEGDTHALLLNNTVKGGSLENKAIIDSLQVAGGLDIAGSTSGGKGFNIGGAAAASKINNDLQSGIKGGSYENLSKVDITADKKSNQIDVAVAGGLTAGGNSKGFAFGGAVAVSDINNNSRAFLNNTTKFESSGVVKVDALDSKNENNRNEYLSSRSINTDPTSYLDSDDKGKFNADGGGNIVNVAFGAGGSTSDAAAGGLGISYAGVSNLVNVDISNNQAITAQNLNANTTNKSNIVDVTIGVAGSNKSFSAAGSFGVSDIVNDGTINIANSNVTADDFLSAAQSKAHIVNIAGQASLANKLAGGLTFAYNAMNNNTGINVEKGTWNVKNFGATATNNNYALAIGAGVSFSKDTGALNGSLGLNIGDNSTKAIVDGSTITGAEKVNVVATDKTSKTTVAGGITLSKSGKVAAGGAVAYANIGSSDDKEVINAKITNATISAKNIDVEAEDKATMTTVGVGVGGSISDGKLTFQGAAAVSELNKDNVAEISNSTISNNPDIKIIATSGGNTSDGLTIDDKNINVNNKVNTAAGALDVNFSSESWFDGALAISVNNFNQSTQAIFKGTREMGEGKWEKGNEKSQEIISRAGNVNMYSNSEADILGVAIGGSGGQSKVGAAGSVSYNYIDNTAKTLAENLNVNATKNFGVVAQSDDKIANYAGAVDVNVNGYGSIGVSVAYNEIKGNTDASIKGSGVGCQGSGVSSDLIAVSNPSGNLIDNYVTKNNWTSGGLMSGRTTENKSGVVVNSSATHSISSDLATIGIRASSNKPGVGISGTVNINKISGETNAKVENTNLTASNTDTFVNAADYTNNGSFVGNAAVSGTVAVGVLWNENQVDRNTNALVDGGKLNVKNLDVKADSEQGLSNLNIAVGAAFAASKNQVFAAASGDNVVRNQMESTTSAKIENATVNHSGAVDVDAYHKDNAYATNMAVGVALDMGGSAGAAFDLGYGLMRENSTVNAQINNSTLTSSQKGAVNVNAQNDSKIAGAFGTAGVAVHAGSPGAAASVAIGINNNYIENTVDASINNSTLDVGAVDVNAKNTSEIKADGGVAALSLNLSKTFFASMGAAVAVTNATFDNKVTAEINKGTITAAGDVNINARDDHKSDETVVAAAASTGVAVAVNRMSTSVNIGLANLTKDDIGDTVKASDLMDIEDPSKSSAKTASNKLTGEYASEERFIDDDTVNSLLGGVHTNSATTKKNITDTLSERYCATVNQDNSQEKGVFASVTNNSNINAGENKITINATENNDLSITSGGGNAALIAGIGVGSTSIEARRANTAKVKDSTLKAKNIDISTTNGQTGSDGIYSKMYNATLAPIGVSVGYNNVETNGSSKISISKANINATENLNATATDNSKSKSYILDAGLKQIGYTGVFAYNTNISKTGIEVSNQSTLTANAINFDAENHTRRATDTLAISINGTLGLQTSTSEANDTSSNFIRVTDAGNTFTATDALTFKTLNGAQTYAYNNGQAYVGLNAIVANGLANSENNSAITIANANSLLSDTINITAQVGEDGKKTAQTEGFAINASTVGVNVDNMTAQTKSTAAVNIGNEIYGDNTTLNISALNKASRDAFMRNNAYALVANANDISSYTIAEDKAAVTVGSKGQGTRDNGQVNKLGALNITADTSNKSYVAAKGTGGAIGGDFGSGAHADNSVNNSSSATLKGTWNITDNLTLNATQHDGAYISGYSARGAIVTGGEGSLDNVIKGSSTATISDKATINAKTVNVNAKNYITTDKYSSDYDHTLYGLMIGLVDDVDDQRSTATTNKSANINIGKNVGITTTGTQIYDAASDYDLKNDVYAEGGSALVSLRWVKSHNYITADEKISVGTGTTLKNEGGSYEDGGITLAAHDNLEHNPTAKGNAKAGAGGYVRAETLTDLTRNQTIDINGTLKSAKDLNLYAGADANGDGSRVHSYARAISQVMTLIDDGGADIIRKGATNSNVNVNKGAYGQAAHDINIISNAGFEAYEERPFYGSNWKSRGKYSVVTSDVGSLTNSGYKHSSNAKVNGELRAANTPDVTINISGVALPDDFILASNKFKNLSYSVKSGNVTITEKNTNFAGKSSEEIFAQQIYNGISNSTVDYANDVLKTRYAEVCKEIANYQVTGRNDVTTYNGFLQEKTALESEMQKLGLGSYVSGEFKVGTSPAIEIKTVILPDIETSGGSINVVTNDFTGSGKLNASGVPKIDIENNSTAYLIANKLVIADKGGAINYNDSAVSSNSAINDINLSKTGATFSDLSIATSAAVPTIKVANNYSGQTSIPMKPNPKADGYSELTADAKKATLQYTPINYIEVAGNVSNPVGKVQITNKQGSIRINKGALVNGMDIEMTARESISQGYTDGIFKVAYTPQDAYKETFTKMRSELGWDKSMPVYDQIVTKTNDDIYKGGTGIHAGEAIYISAQDIIVNGLIQSGYESFEVTVTQKDIDNATETALFNGVTMYKVNEGGEKLDKKKGYYVYEPQVYYDKESNQLYVEDISASGGKVYLAGRISSTGNGKIVVADGAGNIDVKNNTTLDMNIGKITNSSDGLIQIADSELDKLTEYSSGQTRTIENYSAWLANNSKGKVTTSDGLTVGNFVEYNPQSGLTYSWGEGTRKEQITHYYYKEEESWWGASGDDDYTSNLAKLSSVVRSIDDDDKASSWSEPVKTEKLNTNDVPYISTQNEVEHNLTLFAQNVKTEDSYGNHTSDGPHKHGLGGFYRDYDHNWTRTSGSKQIYQYSVKADYPISIGIIGEKNPHINLTNASGSGGDLYLTGDIKNNVSAELNIRANGGKIEQAEGVNLYTDNINLSAWTGVKNIDIINHRTDDLKLNARTTTGDIDVNVTGGVLGDKNLAGNVIVNALKSNYGGVMLTAQGDIKQTIDAASVNAQNIKLDSLNGSINLKIQSGGELGSDVSAISAAAQGDIKLVKTDESDFRIGSIVSTNGDITLTAKGKFVDALDKERDNGSTDESALVKSWIDMGLIAGTDDYKGAYVTKLEQDRDAYKADITEKFNEYAVLLLEYIFSEANYEALKAELDESEPKKSERLQELEEKFGDATTVADDLATEFEEYQTLKTTYDGAVESYEALKERVEAAKPEQNDLLTLLDNKFSNYSSAEEYLAADKDYQALVETAKNPQYQWTQDELLAGIRSSIVNKEEGSDHDTTRLRDANITGKNITLTGAGVGSNVKKATTIKMSELRVKANETAEEKSARLAKISQLANVNAADVKVNYVLADGKPVMQTVTRVNYRYDADKGYYIDTAGNYVRYRKDADGNLLKYTYDKDLNQIGDAVAVSDFSDVIKDTTTIKNKEIESFDISGTIPLGIYATGNITVDTNGNNGIYIASRNKGVKITETTNPNSNVYSPLNITKIESTKADGNFADVRLTGEKGIFNAADSGANVIAKDLILVGGDDSIGTQKKPFAVQLTGDVLNARSNGEVNLQKVGIDNFRVSAVYSPKAIRITNNGYGIIERSLRFDDIAEAHIITPGEITLTGSAGTANLPLSIKASESTLLNLKGNNDFYIKSISGTINLNDIAGNVDISSDESIGQTQTGKNTLTSIKVAATGNVILDGTKNKLSEVYLGAIGGNFELKNASNKLTATFAGTIGGTATITQRGNINLGGSVNGNILNLTSEKGDITSTGGLKATKEINLSVGTFTHEGEIHTDKLTIATDKGVTINNTENTFNSLEISSRDGNAINGSIDVAIKADKFAPSIKNNVAGDVTLENTKKSGTMSFGSGEAIIIDGTFTATTNAGDFDYGSTLNAGKGISITAQNIYRRADTTGNFSSTGRILLNSQNSVGTAANPILVGNHAEKVTGLDVYGKGIYVNGVNSGILTLGNIIGTSFNVNSEGAIAQADNKSLNLTDKVTVTAANDVTLDNSDNVINKAVLNGGDNVKLHSIATNGLTVEGTLKTGGDVTITAEKSLAVNGTIETEKNISLTAGKSTENTATDTSGTGTIDVSKPDEQKEDNSPVYAITSIKNGVLKAGEQITLNAGNVKLLGKVETAGIESSNVETEPGIIVTTRKGLDMQNAANSFEALSIKSSNGEQIDGSILATSNSEEVITRIDDVVTGDLTLTNKNDDGIILMQGYGAENNILDVKGNVTLNMGGTFLAGRAIHSSGDISITSPKGGMFITSIDSNNDVLEATKNLTLKAAENVDIDGNVIAGNNITVNSAGIDVFGQANMEAGKNINLTVKKGDVRIRSYVPASENEIKGALSSKQGTVKITVGEGDIQIGNETEDTSQMDALFAKSNITLKTDKGNIDIKGSTTSDKGTIAMTVDEGNIDISGSATANKGNIAMTLTNGNVDITGYLRAEKGKIDVELGEGSIQVGNETTKQNGETVVFAKGDITMKTGNGTIAILGNHESNSGNIKFETNPTNSKSENTSANVPEIYSYDGTPVFFSANVVETDSIKKPGDITIDAELKANNSVSITTADGEIEVTKKITVTNGDVTISTADGNIIIDSNGSDDMVRAQNNLNINTDNGAVDIAGKISTQDGDITITSNHNSYTAGQKGIIIEETGAINPGRNVYLNATNGDIVFKNVAAQNANINSSSGNVTADTINAADTIRIALSSGDLYLNLARSKGVAIVASDNSKSTVNTIRADSVDVNDAVTVGKVLPYRSNSVIVQPSTPTNGGGSTGSGSSTGYNSYNAYTNAYSSGYSNFASNPSSFAILGTTYTNDGLTYWQSATSSDVLDYSFREFYNAANDMSYRQTRNYFEVKFIPTWLEREFMKIDFDYSFDNFGIRNATEDELIID